MIRHTAHVYRTPTEVYVYVAGNLAYKRWHEPGRPDVKRASAFFCGWTGRVDLPGPAEPATERTSR